MCVLKSWLIGKDSDAGRDWGQEEKGTTEDEMAGWHHRLDGCESEWTPGVGDGQGGLACCNSWGGKESDTTEHLNWTELNWSCVSPIRLCEPMDCSPLGYSVLGILQARMLEWAAISSSRGSSQPRDPTRLLYHLHWQAGPLPLASPGKPMRRYDWHSKALLSVHIIVEQGEPHSRNSYPV